MQTLTFFFIGIIQNPPFRHFIILRKTTFIYKKHNINLKTVKTTSKNRKTTVEFISEPKYICTIENKEDAENQKE
ncbi:hypothetical protein SAMN02787100_1800 [Chryseobacterium sp. OV279]|nr:hypothetical protein SAMN02787100_1800 [Chryseobacterium sp. OV279]